MTDAALFAPVAPAPAAQACAHCGECLRGANDALFCCAGCASAHAIIGAAGLGSFYRRLEEKHAHRPVPLDTEFAGYARPAGTRRDGIRPAGRGSRLPGLRLAAGEPAGAQSRDHPRARPSLDAAPVAALARSGRRRQQPCRPGGGARLPPGAVRRRRRRNRRRPRGARAAALPGRRGLRRRQCHAALGRRLVRPRRIDGRRHAHPLPLAVRGDRPAGGGLCRPPVLPLGLHGAARRPHEHGRADLDRRHPGLHRQPARGVGRRAACLLRLGDHAAVLPADRPLSRPPRARPRAPRRARPAGARQPERDGGGGRRHGRPASGSTGWCRETRCWWAPASAWAPTAS